VLIYLNKHGQALITWSAKDKAPQPIGYGLPASARLPNQLARGLSTSLIKEDGGSISTHL